MSEQLEAIIKDAANAVHDSIGDLSRLGYVGLMRQFIERAFDLGARSGGVSERALSEAKAQGYAQALQDVARGLAIIAKEEAESPAPCSSRGSLNEVQGVNFRD